MSERYFRFGVQKKDLFIKTKTYDGESSDDETQKMEGNYNKIC